MLLVKVNDFSHPADAHIKGYGLKAISGGDNNVRYPFAWFDVDLMPRMIICK